MTNAAQVVDSTARLLRGSAEGRIIELRGILLNAWKASLDLGGGSTPESDYYKDWIEKINLICQDAEEMTSYFNVSLDTHVAKTKEEQNLKKEVALDSLKIAFSEALKEVKHAREQFAKTKAFSAKDLWHPLHSEEDWGAWEEEYVMKTEIMEGFKIYKY